MNRFTLALLQVAASFLVLGGAQALEIRIDTSAAHAVLQALRDPALTHARAQEIARMPGNQGPIRELQGFGVAATQDSLAQALYATAHGEAVTKPEEKAFLFYLLTPRLAQVEALLARIEQDPAGFQDAIRKRIALYAPADLDLKIDGYVVATGDGAGYAFGGTDFYLNLVMLDEFAQAKSVSTHEMYHTVQGGLAAFRTTPAPASPACAATEKLFSALYREGSAVEVADVSLLAQFTGPNALRQRVDMEDGAKHLAWHATLLDMSVAAFQAAHPLPYEEVYRVDFLGHAALYNLGYAMAKAITEAEGPAGLAAFLKLPSAAFVRKYTTLPAYGKDAAHPALGANTLALLDLIERGCR